MEVREEIHTTLKSISGIGKVSHEWPKQFTKLPYIFFRVDDRKPVASFEYNTESDVTVSVTVWDDNSVSALANIITSVMATVHFRKVFEKDNTELENNLKRIDMRFKAYK